MACLDDETNQCERYYDCPTIFIWEGLDKVVRDYLGSVTIQDILDRAALKGGNDFII